MAEQDATLPKSGCITLLALQCYFSEAMQVLLLLKLGLVAVKEIVTSTFTAKHLIWHTWASSSRSLAP